VIKILNAGMMALNGRWVEREIDDGGFAKKVASVFYHLALWPGIIPLSKV
jgi:hypothetical protein